MNSPERPPDIRLSVRETLEFLRIIESETNARPRRLLDYWATPDNLGPHTARILNETLGTLWRSK